MKATTDLEAVKAGAKFTWGYVHKFHTFGCYTILEYMSVINGIQEGIRFHIYIDGKSKSIGCMSLEEAIITAICVKYDGPNTQAPRYIAAMLGDFKEGI